MNSNGVTTLGENGAGNSAAPKKQSRRPKLQRSGFDPMQISKRLPLSESPWIARTLVAVIVVTVVFIPLQIWQGRRDGSGLKDYSLAGCTSSSPLSSGHGVERDQQWLPGEVARTLVHYATSKILPQQKKAEINLTLEVLSVRSPCNFLVFGLGYDSPLWNALNAHGKTVFLEEDSNWIQKVVESQPGIEAYHVQYQTKMSMADALLQNYRRNGSSCSPTRALRSSKCELALTNLPALIYETEWDMIMIDAPRGYFDAAPGRMSAIFTAAVMASNRKKEGSTDIFLHDVDRRVEQMYAGEFLCSSNLVGSLGRLWHFRVPPFSRMKPTSGSTDGFFCPSPMSNKE